MKLIVIASVRPETVLSGNPPVPDPTQQRFTLIFRYPVPANARFEHADPNNASLLPNPTPEEHQEVRTGAVVEVQASVTVPTANTVNQKKAAVVAAYQAARTAFEQTLPWPGFNQYYDETNNWSF